MLHDATGDKCTDQRDDSRSTEHTSNPVVVVNRQIRRASDAHQRDAERENLADSALNPSARLGGNAAVHIEVLHPLDVGGLPLCHIEQFARQARVNRGVCGKVCRRRERPAVEREGDFTDDLLLLDPAALNDDGGRLRRNRTRAP